MEHTKSSVLIIGSGAAGLRTAIELAERGIECLVVGKRSHGDAHTVMAAGGINASLGSRDPEDRWTIHAADTIREGHFVCDPLAVELLARHAPARVRELEKWGCDFNKTDDGKINQRYFGAQSFRRTCFVGDSTGQAILETLVAKARELGVAYRENLYITSIIRSGKSVAGAFGFSIDSGQTVMLHAPTVVLAAGGYTSCYARGSSRPDENTGDAVALAYTAGCRLRDMEFVQFHPTGMVSPEDMAGLLVTEAVRGEGGRLYNGEGQRFMERYSPDAMELDARDVVARAIWTEIREGRGTDHEGVHLDISHRDPEFLQERLPKIVDRFRGLGVDISRDAMEVAPTAHYAMGGIEVDFSTGRTHSEGLYAVGEATAGVHGANRLGGNSLAETVVFGHLTGTDVASNGRTHRTVSEERFEVAARELQDIGALRGDIDAVDLQARVKDLLWQHAGIVRDRKNLEEGVEALADAKHDYHRLHVDAAPGEEPFQKALDLKAMLLVAECILRGALEREESRGAHFREDHAESDGAWQQHITYFRGDDGAVQLGRQRVGDLHPEIAAALAEEHHLDYHHLE